MISERTRDRFEWGIIALVVTAAAATVPDFIFSQLWTGVFSAHQRAWILDHIGVNEANSIALLLFALLLVIPAPVRAGLVLPRLRGAWRWVTIILIISGCCALTWYFAPRLDMPQLRGRDHGYWMWLIGPPAEDLIFAGFLFGKFDQLWPRVVARWLPIRVGVILSACYFSLWHSQNFRSMDAAFVCQQMAYTFAAGILLGLTRQWTGSICFVTLNHILTNCIAWHR